MYMYMYKHSFQHFCWLPFKYSICQNTEYNQNHAYLSIIQSKEFRDLQQLVGLNNFDILCLIATRADANQTLPSPFATFLQKQNKVVPDKDVLYRMATDVGDLKQLILWQSITSGHDNLSHQRIERTWSALWLRCYWPEIFSWVKGDSKNCQRCVVANMPQPVVWTLFASRPLQIPADEWTTVFCRVSQRDLVGTQSNKSQLE